jgi:hypothetical protein
MLKPVRLVVATAGGENTADGIRLLSAGAS